MSSTGHEMLPPFHIRNITSPLDTVRISAPAYDDTLSNNPKAALTYDDDDGDLITVGSSFELEQQLGERPSRTQRRKLAELRMYPNLSTGTNALHVFSIDGDEGVQETWQKLQKGSNSQAPAKTNSETVEYSSSMSYKPRDKESSPCEKPQNPSGDSSCGADFEDFRVHSFHTASPPQPRALQNICNVTDSKALRVRIDKDGEASAPEQAAGAVKGQVAKHRSDTEQEFLAANLTLEGKRQAQLAGEKFRARGLYSRSRKLSAAPADRQSYHNRWASYKSSMNPKSFHPSLTFDNKCQIEMAGDRLRSKTSRMRNAVTAVSDLVGNADQGCNLAVVAESSFRPNKLEQSSKVGFDGQKSLLEVFETELANKPKDSASQTDPPFVPLNPRSAPLMPEFTKQANVLASTNHLAPLQNASTTVEDGIKTAVNGFEVCLRGIIDTLKAAQPLRSDEDILTESTLAFQNLAEKIVSLSDATLKGLVDCPVSKEDNTTDHDLDGTKNFDLQFPVMTTDPSMTREVGKAQVQQAGLKDSNSLPSTAVQAASGRSKRKELRFDDGKSDFRSDFAGPFHYHRPGPIHLPHHSSQPQASLLTHLGDPAPKSSGYVDYLRRFSSADTLKDPCKFRWEQDSDPSKGVRCDRSFSPAAVTTRFPTIGQFENATFSTSMAPPAPPSLIDLDAEEGPKASSGANLGGKMSHSDLSGRDQKDMADARNPRDTAAIYPRAPVELHNKQFLYSSCGVSDGSVANRARLLRPFDAFEGEDMLQNQPDNGTQVHRSATVAAPSQTLRRPYSDVFSGKGRVSWDSFTGQQREIEGKGCSDAQASSTSLPLLATRVTPPEPLQLVKPVDKSGIRRSATDAGARRERRPWNVTYQSPSTNHRPKDVKIRKCVNDLLGLGFNVERSRLRVYASVADGDLDEAIDMLTEDQKVHDSRT